jgi:hypothetical protein
VKFCLWRKWQSLVACAKDTGFAKQKRRQLRFLALTASCEDAGEIAGAPVLFFTAAVPHPLPAQFIRSDDTHPPRQRLTSFVTMRAANCQECLEFTALLLDIAEI